MSVQNIAYTTLTICALIITAIVVKNEFGPQHIPAPSNLSSVAAATIVEDWQEFKSEKSVGPKSAPVKIIVFSDYTCRFCKQLYESILLLTEELKSEIEVMWHDHPLELKSSAFLASLAATCAHEQNMFSEAHDILFRLSDSVGIKPWESIFPSHLALNVQAFEGCLQDTVTYTKVLDARNLAGRISVDGTPTFLINQYLYRGAIPTDSIRTIINKILVSQTAE